MSCKELDLDSKMAKAFHNISKLRPFYSAIYENMERVETDEISTMGVTYKKLLYNRKFIDSLHYEELMFVDLHEIAHIALMHVTRTKHRDKQLWNIACDLYVNKILSEEFNIGPGNTSSDGNVRFWEHALFCDSIDTENECVEDIYDALYEQGNKNGYNASQHQLSDITEKYHFEYEGKLKGTGSVKRKKYEKFETDITLDSFECDLQQSNDADEASMTNELKRILNGARVKFNMNNAGENGGKLLFHVDEILKSHLDWRKLLRKYCIAITGGDLSFNNPDKRMFYQQYIYPGQARDEQGIIKNIKVCFDSSGSISDTDIAYYYGQVLGLLKEFKIEAELIYWDAEIASCGKFSDFHEMKRVSAAGRGGTNPACLFKYFDSRSCKTKPAVTLVFTDGYIIDELNNPKWKAKYKDTIWVMTKDYNKEFKPVFGKLAIARYSE